MRVTQNSQNMIVNWQSFNIGKDAGVNFAQPNSQSNALNRVMSADPSYIMGSLTSNGRVFLVNPSGVMFGNGAQVNVGSLVASTLEISNSNFMSGNYVFEKNGSAGSVVNQGNLKAANGGFVAMLAPEVINQGLISARLGTVALAAGDKVSLDIKGDGLLSFNIDKAALKALAQNRGLIQADGGKVILGARSAGDLMATVVNNTGVIEANSVTERNGVIILDGGSVGVVTNEGSLIATGTSAGQTGGTIKVLGDKVGVMAGAVIDASGQAGGGEVLVGGNYQGKGTEQNASVTYVDKEALIKANAIDSGNGGRVIIWADDTTRFYGVIEAKGGANGGDGGFVETSGKNYLDFQGDVSTFAVNGKTGTLLLDPTDITIQSAGSTTPTYTLTGTIPNQTWADNGANAATSILTTGSLQTSLANSNITVTTASGAGSGGTILVINPIAWSSGNSLTLTANSGVTILSSITSTGAPGVNGGAFTISAGGSIVINANITTTGGTGNGTHGGDIVIGANSLSGGITMGPGVSLNSSGDNSGGSINNGAGRISLTTGLGGTLITSGAGTTISALGKNGGESNTISLTADLMTFTVGGTQLYGETVNIAPRTSTRAVSLGGAGGGLLLDDAAANAIHANNVYISSGSGNITHNGDFSLDNFGGGEFSIVTTGTITDSPTGVANLGPTSTNASNYILSGSSLGAAGAPILTEHSPVLTLTSVGNIYVAGSGATTSLTVNSTSNGTGTFAFTNIDNSPSITTGAGAYTLTAVDTHAMRFSFKGMQTLILELVLVQD
jgi:filamentous hemagglutinin family protein